MEEKGELKTSCRRGQGTGELGSSGEEVELLPSKEAQVSRRRILLRMEAWIPRYVHWGLPVAGTLWRQH